MATHFVIVTTYPDVEFVGGTTTREVQVAGATTKPHGVYFEVRVPMAAYEQDGPSVINTAAEALGAEIEALLALPHVGSVLWGQQSHGGQLRDVLTITVLSKSGSSSAPIVAPLAGLSVAAVAKRVVATSQRLDETEAL